MSLPKNDVVQIDYQNPDAKQKLMIPVLVTCNTSDEMVEKNIIANSAKPLDWLQYVEPHAGVAIMVGGGASITDEIHKIRYRQSQGGVVFAMNAASAWLHNNGVAVDYQCIADAKEETGLLIDHNAKAHIVASQVDSKTMDSVMEPIVWHLRI